MQALRLALAQVNPTFGDIAGNCSLVRSWASRAAQDGAQVILFPQMVVTGYYAREALLGPPFAENSSEALDELAVALDRAGCGDTMVVVGHVYGDGDGDGVPSTGAAVVFGGAVVARYEQSHPPARLCVVEVNGFRLGLLMGEDIRTPGVAAAYAAAGIDALLCLGARPYQRGAAPSTLIECCAAEADVPVAYVDLVGGQDEVVFDGGSVVVAADGTLLGRAPEFTEHLLHVDIDPPLSPSTDRESLDGWEIERITLPDLLVRRWDRTPAFVAPRMSDEEQVWSALVTGLRDYAHKNGHDRVVVELSGDVSSAVVASVAVDALGSDAVYGISIPTQDSSELARNTGIHLVPDIHECPGSALRLVTGAESAPSTTPDSVDAVFAPLVDVPKPLVEALARWRNAAALTRAEAPPVPEHTIDRFLGRESDDRRPFPIGTRMAPPATDA